MHVINAMTISSFSEAEVYPEHVNQKRPVYPAHSQGWKRNNPFGFLYLIQQQGIEIRK